MAKKNGAAPGLPSRILLVGWVENQDLRLLRRCALALVRKYKLSVGEALLVSGSRYKGARRYQFVVKTADSAVVVAPQTGKEDLMLSLALRVSEFVAERF